MFSLRFPYELAAFFALFSLPRLPLRHLHAWQLSVTLRGPARVASGREGWGLHGQLSQGDLLVTHYPWSLYLRYISVIYGIFLESFRANVGKYSSTMEHMGFRTKSIYPKVDFEGNKPSEHLDFTGRSCVFEGVTNNDHMVGNCRGLYENWLTKSDPLYFYPVLRINLSKSGF